jgi:Tfp pilus assembly protein PilO
VNISQRQQLLLVVAIAALVLLVGDRLVFQPLLKTWKDRSAEITQLKKSVEQSSQLLAREAALREHWERMRTNTLSSESSVAENQMLQAFYRWSQDSRITVNGIKPQWKHNSDDYATFECRVDAAGTLADITRFLFEIEKDSLGVRLDVVEITSRDDRGQQLTVGLQVSGLQLNPPPMP